MTSVGRLALASLALALGIAPVAPAYAQTSAHFFPKRPAAPVLHELKGVLTSYGVGNDTGGFTIRPARSPAVTFYIAYPMKFDGRINACTSPTACPAWPKHVTLGRTVVVARYWWTTYPATHAKVRVSDSLTVASS